MTIANPHLEKTLTPEEQNNRLKTITTIASVTVASVLLFAKAYVYFQTESVTILSSLMDSTMDALASLIALIGVRQAMRPQDANHRYGHGKYESLSALLQSVFIFGSSFFLYYEAMSRFFNPKPIANIELGVGVMALSIVLTIVLVVLQTYTIKRTNSAAISADSLHYKSDLLMNISIIAALVLADMTGYTVFDPLFAFFIAMFMMRAAYDIGKESFDVLLDAEIAPEDRAKIIAIASSHPKVQAVHDMRTRHNGQRIFIELHAEIDGAMSLKDSHDVTEDVERMIYDAFPNAEIIIHQEPAGIDDHRIDAVIEGGK